MYIGSEKFYFIPDLNVSEFIVHKGHVLAEEFDNVDRTIKVRFLDGNAVQKFAVADTEEELKPWFDKFQEYREKFWDCRKRIVPIEMELQNTYAELFGEFMNIDFGKMIARRHDADAATEESGEAANDDGSDI